MKVCHEIARKFVPREAYLACDDTDTLFPSCVSRFTNDASHPSAVDRSLQQKFHEKWELGARLTARRPGPYSTRVVSALSEEGAPRKALMEKRVPQ